MRTYRAAIWVGGARLAWGVVVVAGLVCLMCLPDSRVLFAQGITSGSISGSIVDSSGAAIPGAEIKVTRTATGTTQTVTTNAEGLYTVPNLTPGTYTLNAEKAGFKAEVRQNILVSVGVTSAVDITMSVGAVTQTVTVSAQVAPIHVNSANRSLVIQHKVLTELPVQVSGSWRQDDTFLTLSPGVTGNNFSAKINGAPDMAEDFYYDGSPYMNADGGGRQEGEGPALAAIDTYSFTTSPYSAKYGRAVGVVNYHIKSGTNHLHGSAWDYLRNNALDARGFFSPTVGTEKQNEYGFNVGGPVYIPGIYNGKNKTFFFFQLDWFKFRGGLSSSLITLPTAQMKQGDFSQLPFPIYDATTGKQFEATPAQNPACTAPNPSTGACANVIPTSLESKLSAPWIALMPTATLPGIVGNARASVPAAPQNYRQYLMKFDHTFSPRLKLEGSYYRNHLNFPTSPVLPGPLGGGNNFNVNAWEPRLSLDWTVSPNVMNQTNFSVQYTEGARIFFPHVTSAPNSLATVGLPYPAFAISGMPTFGVGANDNQVSGGCWACIFLADNLKWMRGRQEFSLGGQAEWQDERDAFASNIGTYSFGNRETSLPSLANPDAAGYGFASFYLGLPDTVSRSTGAPPRLTQTRYFALYGEDDIHMTRKLTVNLGLRWDVSLPVKDPHNEMSTFDPTVPNPGAGNLLGSLVYTGTSGGPCISQGGASLCRSRIANTYWTRFYPRVGFAYRLTPKTVVRSGFGVFDIRGGASTLMGPEIAASFLTGFEQQSLLQTPNSGFSPAIQPTWDVGIPPIPPLPARTRSLANAQNVDFMQPVDGEPGYVMQWSFGIERELPWQVGLSVSYVGSGGVGIGSNLLNENQVQTKWLSLGNELFDNVTCLNNGTCPNAAAAGVKDPYPGFTGSLAQALRPFPQYLYISANTQANGHETYHSLQAKAQKYFSHGVSFLVSYTWFKNLDNTDSQFSTFTGNPLDTYNQGLEKANDVSESGSGQGPQLLSIAGTYELPFGPGKSFINKGGPIGKVVGGWTVAPVLTYDAGPYLQVIGGTGQPLFNGAPRPNIVPGVNSAAFFGGRFNPAVDRQLNVAAFSDPGPFALGNAPRSLPNVRGFANINENFALIKRTPITESTNLEFRAEFYNAFNRVQFCNGDGNWNDRVVGAFGEVFGQCNTPRFIQFALQFNF